MIDLHTHSDCSDGTYTPEALIDYAISKGLTAIALTDHDTVDGVERAVSYAASLKKAGKTSIEVIPGIEFSAENNGKDVHIVGLFVDYTSMEFLEAAKNFRRSRENRNIKMCEKFKEAGFDISYEELLNHFPNAIITRAHFAKLLLEKGYTSSIKEAFDRFIGDNGPFFVPREKADCKHAIEMILNAGGIPILAHPTLYHMSNANIEALIKLLKSYGLMGIETKYTTYTQGEEAEMHALANKYHLLSSGGSDFHGSNKPLTDLGIGHGKLYIHEEMLDKLKMAYKKVFFTDLDGTLLNDKSEISVSLMAALEKLANNGHYLVLTSGRPLESIKERVKYLGISHKNLILVANNGGVVYSYELDKNINEVKLNCDIVKKLECIAKKYNVHIQGYTDKEIVVYSEDEELKTYRKRIHIPFVVTEKIADYLKNHNGSYKALFIDLCNHGLLENVKNEVLETLGDDVEVFFSNDRYLEVAPKGISKGRAVNFVTEYLGIHPGNTFAAGDEENDISMIITAHTGIAMKNAKASVKEVADIITEKTNDEDGLLDIINYYFL